MKAFDVCGPLPSGVTVLEASAGTGKTFTIAALATRYIAEAGVSLEHLLLVTFTRMATGELRQRVRERMVSAEDGLRRVLAGEPTDPADEVLARLADAPADEVARRRERLRVALAGFDGATIDTTHAFCQRVLHGMGVIADVDRDAMFVEESRDLVEEVVTDFYLRKFARGTGRTDFSLDDARRMALRVVANPDAALYPPETGNPRADVRRAFAERVRDEVERRRRRSGLLTFDDLLTRLRDTLADDDRGAAACARLRSRYRVALVDEFQDTDPIQWEILKRAFVDDDADATLVLIGDPKQAIYAFRGADVYAYLDAAATAGSQATLETNWRSDQPLLDAYDALFAGAALGHEGIVCRDVQAAAGHEASRLADAPVAEPLRIRMLHRDRGLVKLTPKAQALNAAGARAVIADDLAADAVRLLSSPATIDGRPVRPGDLAVLVARNADAFAVRDALDAAGVPAVVNGAGSVFATPAARDWLRLLEALERPSSTNAVRAAALTSFLGWSAEQVATADDGAWEDVHARLHRWAGVLRRRGVAALFETVSQRERLAERLLARAQGERVLTDLRHVAQLLHQVVTVEQLGLTALVAWLHVRMDEIADDAGVEDRSRRLESDAEAVQVLTIYRSKGLEFPVVYLPYLWHPGYLDEDDPPVFHDATNGDVRTIDVSGDPASDAISAQLREVRGEELRLAYVALTRARHQAVVWWAATWDSRNSSLGRFLFARDPKTGRIATSMQYPVDDPVALAAFDDLAARAPVSVEEVEGGPVPVWVDSTSTAPAGDLAARAFARTLDPRWRRTSYSSITEGAHELRVASEPEAATVTDEGLAVAPAPTAVDDDSALRAVGLPLGGMRAGAEVGTFVHGMFERADFAAVDLDAELAAAHVAESAHELVHLGDPAAVLAGLRAAIETPLGPLVGGLRLRDLARRDRVDELTFELPLVGGDDPSGVLTVAAIGDLLEAHLPAGDVLRPYAERLHDPVLAAELRGYLTGSLDLTLRTPDGRYAVVDYKTNRLGRSDEELTAWHYRPDAVVEAMFGAHYPLQALLYTVALHRYLRWRLAGYSPDRHLAGVLYLFVRGMIGEATPVVGGQPCGVFAWAPPPALVEALSDLFDRGAGAEDSGMTVLDPATAATPPAVTDHDPCDVRLARSATGLLREFNEAGALAAADVHVAQRLGALAGETDERVLLGAAFAVRGPRLGHICVDLGRVRDSVIVEGDVAVDLQQLPWPEGWVEAVAASPLVGDDRPLRLEGTRLYLDRYWREEQQVAADLRARSARVVAGVDGPALDAGLDRLFPPTGDDDLQRKAAAVAVGSHLAVVAGGPGTGKTTTVARILALLHEQARATGAPPPLVALAAPTGKAAARLEEAVHEEAAKLTVDPEIRDRLLAASASTLHRLLGWKPGNRARFRHDRTNRLPHEVVIVDETSMVSLTLMARLLEAVRPTARLILVGDPEQLASVEAGAVLGDIVGPADAGPAAVDPSIVVLRRVHRFGGAIAALATAVQAGEAGAVLDVLRGGHADVAWSEVDVAATAPSDLVALRAAVVEAGIELTGAATGGDGRAALDALGRFRLLCAHRRGDYGVVPWTAQVETWLAAEIDGFGAGGAWYPGRPLLFTENDYGLQLYNGDTGVVVAGAGGGAVRAVFERRGQLLELSPHRLGRVETVHAMTVHKSQGSQFRSVALLLPDQTSPILTRELFYTAATRARERLLVVGTEAAVVAAVERPIARASGLRELLSR